MQRLLAWLGWFAGLFVLWLLFVGTASDWMEWIGGVFAAAIGATAAEVVREQGLLAFRADRQRLRMLPSRLWLVVVEFGVLAAELVRQLLRPRVERGAFSVVEFPAGGERRVDRGRRALVAAIGSLAPNTLVVDVDEEHGRLLVHELVPRRIRDELP